MENTYDTKLLISQREAAFLLDVSYQTVRTWISQKKVIPQYIVRKIGGRTLIHRAKFEKWLDENPKYSQDILDDVYI